VSVAVVVVVSLVPMPLAEAVIAWTIIARTVATLESGAVPANATPSAVPEFEYENEPVCTRTSPKPSVE